MGNGGRGKGIFVDVPQISSAEVGIVYYETIQLRGMNIVFLWVVNTDGEFL